MSPAPTLFAAFGRVRHGALEDPALESFPAVET
jgi:hypothetical protein